MTTIVNYFNSDYSNYYFQEVKPTKPFHTYIFDAVTYIPSAAWEKVKDAFSNKAAFINQRMNEITGENDPARQKELFIAALSSNDFHILRPRLMTYFQGLNSADQDQYLKQAVLEGVKLRKNDLITRCLHLLSEQDLKNLIISNKQLNQNFDFMRLVKNHIRRFEINDRFQPYDANMAFVKSELKTLIPQAFNFLMSIFDTLMMSTELFEVGQAPKSAWDAAYQLDVYYRIIAIPATILWTINAYVPNPIVTGTAFVLTCLALIGFIYSYVKWLKPSPNHIPKTINLTEKAQNGEIIPVVGRGLEITTLKNQLVRNLNSSNREHPLVVGESGVGKTTIIEGLTLEISKGNIPELKGAKVFMVNAAELSAKSMYNENSALSKIRKAIGNHQKKIVLVIDEIHSLMADATLRTELLSLLDNSSNSIPLFIGLTSTDQFTKNQEFFNEPATKRRLRRKIDIEGTDEDHTVTILKSMLHHFYPEVSDIDEELCRRIYQLNKDKPGIEPVKSKSSISYLAEKIRSGLQGNHLNEELEKLLAEHDKKQSEEVRSIDGDLLLNDALDDLDQLEARIATKKDEITTYNQNVDSFKSLKNKRRDREVVIKKIADKIMKPGISEKSKDKMLHQFLFEQFYLLPSITEKLSLFATKNDLRVTITEEMITDLLGFGYQSMIDKRERTGNKETLDEERKNWKAQFAK